MFFYVLSVLYLCLWAILLIHCLKSSRLYPIFGNGLGTKAFWLFTFVFLNPLLSLLYILCAFCPVIRKWWIVSHGRSAEAQVRSSRQIAIPLFVFIYTCIILVLFEIPRTNSEMNPFVILNKTDGASSALEGSFLKSGANIGFIDAKNKIQTVSSNSATGDMRVNLHNIMLMCKNDNQFLHRVAMKIQQSFARLPYVDSVIYYSYGHTPEPGGLMPDVFITLDMPEMNENIFLFSREMQLKIDCTASSSFSEVLSDSVNNISSDIIVPFKIQSELQHASKTICIECPGTEYEHEVKNITRELTEAMKKQFENLLNKYDELPELPEILYGSYIKPPEFSFLKNNIEFMISGIKLLKDNDTIWQFTEKRDNHEAFEAYNEELKMQSWTLMSKGDNYIRMRKSNEIIYIFRRQLRDLLKDNIIAGSSENNTSETPMIAHYSRFITSERINLAMNTMLEKGEDFETLLLFRKYFITPNLQERLCNIIKQNHSPTLDGYILLGNFYADKGDIEKAGKALMFARAMQLVEKEPNTKAHEIKSLAEKLGDENLIDIPFDGNILRQSGFICIEDINEPMQIERGLDEPALFYRNLGDNQIQTFALSVIQQRDNSFRKSYHLLTVEEQGGNSSSSESDGINEPDGRWTAQSYLHEWLNEGMSVQFKIESSSNERFIFTITPGSV